METKLYIRDGKRFKYVPNMLGMYWNGVILTKIRMRDSIAIVIEQHYDHVVMASLEMSKYMSWYNAKEWCENSFNRKGRLPSKKELISFSNYFNPTSNIWGEEYSSGTAWRLRQLNSGIDYDLKSGSYYMRTIAVTDVPILNLI